MGYLWHFLIKNISLNRDKNGKKRDKNKENKNIKVSIFNNFYAQKKRLKRIKNHGQQKN